jgi:aflatoxin B1 aldehyde reductase
MQADGVKGKKYILGTKAHPSQNGGLSAAGLREQLESSLTAMGISKVDVFYLHQPDPENDLSESLECLQALIKEGKIAKYGLSNYSAVEVERCCTICQERQWQKPRFYQGLYNPLNRLVEKNLLPILRRNDIGFVAYNPLAAGLLTGKHKAGEEVQAGRFKDNPNYLPRFYTDANFEALGKIQTACDTAGIGLVPATYAWLLRSSALRAKFRDGLLIGASSTSQLEQNLTACRKPVELPSAVKDAFDAAWTLTSEGAFPYWRSYSKDHPDRDNLDPGASYNAAKK